MSRVFNFSAGPATLPEPVLAQVRDDLFDWRGSGMSVMEMSHRDAPFMSIAQQCEADLRELLAIPSGYRVLFMQGGASAQFSVVPMNLLRGCNTADYVINGQWGKKAFAEARRYCEPRVAAEVESFTSIPAESTWQRNSRAAYLHYTSNETVDGVEFNFVPRTEGSTPLVADVSSNFLSRPFDVASHGLIYAGAQKNAGPAGLTVVIVRDELLGHALPETPTVFDYRGVADADSMLNTPPCFTWYVCGLVFRWLLDLGGLPVIAARNAAKSKRLYDYLDAEPFYSNAVAPEARSRMNVVFRLADPGLDAAFLKGANEAGLSGLKGHRSVGGMRASLYNAMPEAGVSALIDYLQEFVRRRG